jgi:hypothetical protein
MFHLFGSVVAAFVALTPAGIAGMLGVAAGCSWPLFRTRRSILVVQVLSSVLFALHYGLLGAHTAAAMCVAGVVQGVAATLLPSGRARNGVFAVTIAASLAVTGATFAGLSSVLAQTGQILSAVGRLRATPQEIRLCGLASESMWTSHNLLVGSTWGLASDAMSVTMMLVGLWRGMSHPHPAGARVAAA